MEYATTDLNGKRRNEKCWTRDNEITIWNGVEQRLRCYELHAEIASTDG